MPDDAVNMMAAALDYAGRGFPIFPVATGFDGRMPKIPLVAHWREEATTNEATVLEWWGRNPDSAIGFPTGAASGLIVLDIDTKGGVDGFATLEAVRADGVEIPAPIATSRTPSGGAHLFFRAGEIKVGNSAGRIGARKAPGLDVRGDGGFVILPPSRIATGAYEWAEAENAPVS